MPAVQHDMVPLDELVAAHVATAKVLQGRGAPGFCPGASGIPGAGESPGEAFVRSEAYKRWLADFPAGGPSQAQAGSFRSAPLEAKYSLASGSGGARALVTSADASAGTLVSPITGALWSLASYGRSPSATFSRCSPPPRTSWSGSRSPHGSAPPPR
jgi:hypothetical protein